MLFRLLSKVLARCFKVLSSGFSFFGVPLGCFTLVSLGKNERIWEVDFRNLAANR